MGNNQASDYKKELRHRLLAVGISGDEFFERFCERHGVQDSLRTASNQGPADYEEELDTLVGMAEKDYDHYTPVWSSHVEEGDISPKKAPKKKRRTGKPKDIAGAWERQAALGRYLAGVALEDKQIIGFRRAFLSGRVLSAEEALIFLSAPSAAAEGSRHTLKMLGVNPLDRILDSNYRSEEGQDDSGSYRRLVWGPRRSSTIRPLGATASRLIFPGDVVTSDELRSLRLRGGRAVIFPHPREKNQLVVAQENSVIAHMVSLVERALKGYPLSLEMGVWFILTGEFFPVDPVRIHYMTIRRPELLSRTTITLEVESWLPPEEVLEQYRHAQTQILGGTPRSLKRRTVALFEFVNQHKEKSWRERFDAWNKAYRNQRFRDRSHLCTTYMRALENIVGVRPTKDEDGKQLKVAGTDPHRWPIIANKWYILHPDGYTGSFESREEAEADPRSESSEVLTAEQLVARLVGRTKDN
jgi:hypothetical protein